MQLDTIWLATRRRLRGELAEKDWEAWIEPLRAARWAPGELTLEAPSGFFRDWLRRHFLAAIEAAVAAETGAPAVVAVVVNRALDARKPAASASARAERAGIAGEPPPSRYTFDNFVVGASNQVAYGAARAVVAEPGARFNPLFVYGGVGLGKTHLLSAIAHALSVERRHGAVAYLSAENFVNEMIAGLRADRMDRFRRRFRNIETLVVDDVQFLAGKMRSQEEFYHTFDALHGLRKQIVLASDRVPEDMPGIEETLRSRFSAGLLVDVKTPDPALRMALLRRKAAALGLDIPADVAGYVAEGWCGNVRQLEGALTRLSAFASLSGRPVDLALVREVLGAPPASAAGGATVERIIGEVCQHFRLTRAELESARRTARIAVPRQVAMYLCRHHTDVPLAKIGAKLGGRDHATVLHALSAIERRLANDAALRESMTALRSRLGS